MEGVSNVGRRHNAFAVASFQSSFASRSSPPLLCLNHGLLEGRLQGVDPHVLGPMGGLDGGHGHTLSGCKATPTLNDALRRGIPLSGHLDKSSVQGLFMLDNNPATRSKATSKGFISYSDGRYAAAASLQPSAQPFAQTFAQLPAQPFSPLHPSPPPYALVRAQEKLIK